MKKNSLIPLMALLGVAAVGAVGVFVFTSRRDESGAGFETPGTVVDQPSRVGLSPFLPLTPARTNPATSGNFGTGAAVDRIYGLPDLYGAYTSTTPATTPSTGNLFSPRYN